MASALAAWARLVVRHRGAVLAAVLAVSAVLAVAATRLRVEVDPDAQLPQDHRFIQALHDVHRLFGDKNLVVIGLTPRDGRVFTPAFLGALDRVTRRVRRIPGANPSLVQSIASPEVKDVAGTADGMTVEPVMPDVPADQAGADAVRARVLANEAFVGTLVSADGSAAAIQASFELGPQMPGYRQLADAVRAAVAEEADQTFEWRLSGPVVFLAQLSSYSSRMAVLFPVALVVIGLVHWEAFRTGQALILPLATAILSVVWALGLMGAVGVPLDPFNTTTPILILAVAAGHAVQVLKRFYEEYDRVGTLDDAIVACLERVGPVMLAAGAVAALSFCSLVTFKTATIRTFGLFTGFGIVSALVIEMTLIPAVRAMLPAPRRRELEREAAAHPFLDRLLVAAGTALRRPQAVLVAAGCFLLLCALLATRVEVNTSLKGQFRERDAVRVDDAVLNARFAGTNTLILLVEAAQAGGLEEPAALDAIWRLQHRLAEEPGVGRATSYVDFVRRMHHAMNADRPDAGDLPGTRGLVAQYLLLHELDTLLDADHRVAKLRLLVHEDGTAYGEALIDRADALARELLPPGLTARFTGSLASTAAATEVMVDGKLRNIVQIAAITVAVSALLLGSVVAGLLVAVPLAIAVAANFGAMGLLGMPLDSMTAVISAMAVGIGADYAMYYLFRVREECADAPDLATAQRRALATSGKAILFVSSAVALGYATLCLSGFRAHVALGGLVALAMVTSSAGALVLLPSLLAVLRPRFLEAPEAAPLRQPAPSGLVEGDAQGAAMGA